MREAHPAALGRGARELGRPTPAGDPGEVEAGGMRPGEGVVAIAQPIRPVDLQRMPFR
ncbi:hypothetical protein D3C72_2152740 [compost metagenome]